MTSTAPETPTAAERVPFAMRFAARQTSTTPDTSSVVYDRELQVAVGADGNPWSMGKGKSETSSNTNSDSKNDEGTDFY